MARSCSTGPRAGWLTEAGQAYYEQARRILEDLQEAEVPQDLVHHNCLTYTLVPGPNEWMFGTPDGGREVVSVRGSLQANTSLALRSAAVAGVGITASTTFIVHEDIARGAGT